MARSLKDLIEFLLEEISLCGDQGAAPNDVLSFIDDFYSQTRDEKNDWQGIGNTRVPNVDQRFKDKVWIWLTNHPEVSIGKNGKEGALSRDKLGAHSPRNTPDAARQDTPAGNEILDEASASEARNEHPDIRSNPKPEGELRLFVSQERMWLAITGHEPDSSRVLPMEFALLSTIASRKEKGIVQSDLVRVSGQDKRSVPKRTDSLQKKGYIEKRAIQYKSSRTSLCVLTKFAGSGSGELSYVPSPVDGTGPQSTNNKIIDFSVLLDKLFRCLKEYEVITREDLKKKIDMQDIWHSKALRRAIRKLEVIGCVRRVKAISQYSKVMKSSHPSIMLIREPTEKDIQLFHDDSKNLVSSMEQGDADIDVDEYLDHDEPVGQSSEPGPSLEEGSAKQEYIVEAGRIIPQWSPDRNLANMIFDIVSQAGTKGLNNLEINAQTVGIFYRRPLESILARLTENWQHSQPLHLRHLSLIRDVALRGTVLYYIQYSFENFATLVNEGQASWDVLESTSRAEERGSKAQPIGAKPVLDKYGFPAGEEPSNLLGKGHATLRECLQAAKPTKYTLTMNDPVAMKLEDGTYGVNFSQKKRIQQAVDRLRRAGAPAPNDRQIQTSSPLKRTAENVDYHAGSPVSQLMVTGESGTALKRRKVSKQLSDSLEGLSEKQRLEAQGLDETWTEYNVLLIERPTSGIYITPRGKRRPVGKARGRPGKSRIAVFKLPKLKDFDWFVRQQSPEALARGPGNQISDAAVVANADVPQKKSRPTRAVATARSTEGATEVSASEDETVEGEEDTVQEPVPPRKRKQMETASEISPSNAISEHMRMPGKSPKRLKLAEDKQSSKHGEQTLITRVNNKSTGRGLERECRETEVHEPQVEKSPLEALDTRVVTGEPINNEDAAETHAMGQEGAHDIVAGIKLDEANVASTNGEEKPATAATNLQGFESTPGFNQEGVADKKKKGPIKREMRGGSVAFLRKRIIMDILGKCGGLFPMGTELWYPFTTSWLKTKQTEKPDMRTLKNMVKSLVETGKIQQHTFTGRDSKGLMVTKSIIAEPGIGPNDERMRNLRNAMLDADPHLYFPPGADVDLALRKSERNFMHREIKLPKIEGEVKVKLHQIPAVSRRQTERAERRWRLRELELSEADSAVYDRTTPSGDRPVHRLKSIKKFHPLNSVSYPVQQRSSPTPGPSVWPLLPSKYPLPDVPSLLPRESLFRSRLKVNSAAMSMLMSPSQAFHAVTGTFGTGIRTIGRPRRVTFKPRLTQPHLITPASLEDILALTGNRKVDPSRYSDPASVQFFYDVDLVKKWECRHQNIFDIRNEGYEFINHTIPGPFEAVSLEDVVRFSHDELPPTMQIIPTRKVTRRSHGVTESSVSQEPTIGLPPKRRQKPVDSGATRRLAQLQESKAETSTGKYGPKSDVVARRPRQMPPFPEKAVQRLMTAIVVVRTLAGGVEGRMVEWRLIEPIFPDYSLKLIHDRGRVIISRHRLQIAKMQSDFQERFADAYERNEVPPIDYSSLDTYDWEWLVDWAADNLEQPSLNKLPSLPATREQFDSLFEIRQEPRQHIDELYQYNASITIPRRRTMLANTPFTSLLPDSIGCKQKSADMEFLDVAKTWVRANIVAAEETYQQAAARQTLERFGEVVVGQAIQSLITERVISMGNKGRVAPGRNYDLTEVFLNTLTRRRAIESTQLKRAAYFKTNLLDPAMKSQGKYEVKYGAEDGDILVLINLAAQGRIILSPRNPPRNRYGLTDGGYLTRLMDKGKLRFDIDVFPVPDRYFYGNPIAKSVANTPIPKGDVEKLASPATAAVLPKIPLWFDIHVQFVKILWDLVTSAILGILAARPGLGVKGITRMLDPCLAEWETKLVANWMADVGVIEKIWKTEDAYAEDFSGFVLKDPWWMLLGSVSDD